MIRKRWLAVGIGLPIALIAYVGVRVAIDVLSDLTGPPYGSDGPHSGWNAIWAGDVDGDGTPDVLLITQLEPVGRWRYGRARVFSGKTRKCLLVLPNPQWPEFTYWLPAPAGDVNGDGREDLFTQSNGMRVVIDALDGRQLLSLENRLYELSAPVGDIDNDGCCDLLVSGQPGAESPRRFVSLVSGKSNRVLWSVEGRDEVKQYVAREFGHRVGTLADIDGDGTRDLAIGSENGDIRVVSGRDGTTLPHARVDDACFSDRVVDFDRDGISDLLTFRNVEGEQAVKLGDDVWRAGRVEVISGRDQAVLFALDGNDLTPIGK